MLMRNLNLFGFISMLALVLFTSCDSGKRSENVVNSPELANYVSAYTSGVISTESELIVRFTESNPLAGNFYEALEHNPFTLDPQVEGQAYWINGNTIAFKPLEKFEQAKKYNASFNLSSLLDVSGQLSEFYFSFQTRVQDFKVHIAALRPYPGQGKYYFLSGDLDFADVFEQDKAAQILNATQNGKALDIEWRAMQSNRLFEFTIDSILRGKEVGKIEISWDGSTFGIENKDNENISVPSLSDFELLDVRVYQLPSQRVVISFSDQLKAGQELDGLISLDDDNELTFRIDGNELEVFSENTYEGPVSLMIEPGIKSVSGAKIRKQIIRELSFSRLKPQVSLVNRGVILPSSQGLMLPFKAVGLNSVDVRIIKIFESNIPQFLQVNKIDNDYEIRRVGRPVLRHTIDLASTGLDMNTWNFFSIDLSDLITPEPGAIYNIEFSFFKKYSAYECSGVINNSDLEAQDEAESFEYEESSFWDNLNSYYWGYWPDGYDWREEDNPCHVSYYTHYRFVSTNVLASDLGLIVKSGSADELLVAITDLISAEPLQGVSVAAYNYQLQKIGSGISGADGLVEIKIEGNPFMLIAEKEKQKGYLRIDDGSALSVSNFDVSGKTVEKGLRGYIYGDRGVWRPGDTLFLNFILDDRQNRLPEEHPVVFELLNPQGRVIKRLVRTEAKGNIYDFMTTTSTEAPTGSWTARVKVGGVVFTKSIRIETVKPNRLKLSMDMGKGPLKGGDKISGDLIVKWLHGAPARNLKAKVDVSLYKSSTGFEKYPEYTFQDPSRYFYPDDMNIFDGKLNMQGEADINFSPPYISNAPGMLKAAFTVRAFEEGGDFSTDFFTMDYAPYEKFIGIKLPVGDKRGMLLTDTSHTVDIISCDADGNPVSIRKLNAAIYKVSWRWWWNASDNDMATYFGSEYAVPIEEAIVYTNKNGKGVFKFKIEYPDWGRYFVRVWDENGGAATGKTVYIDWPGWAGQAKREFPGAASLLTFTADKTNYKVGEIATVVFPSSSVGRALLTIESGSGILDADWVIPQGEQSQYSFEITPEMAPNVYVSITLVQPHSQSVNDAPIRLYGTIPIMVEDPDSRITPVLEMPDVLEPEKQVNLKVYEMNGMPMTYTIAMVDEGLLDLTRFKTPDPWKHFYAREALGVKTWDLYSYVIGAYGGKLEKVFGIGGGDEMAPEEDIKANRFKPVVKFLGPFKLEKGETAKHSFIMPNYIGSVRTMVVSAGYMAYGSTEKTTAVKKPLMVLATLPRVLGPGEKVSLPVTVFAMQEDVKDVSLNIKANNLFTKNNLNKKVHFDAEGDMVVNFELETIYNTGTGKVEIEAVCGNYRATYIIDIEVRNPNPPITYVFRRRVIPGETITHTQTMPGMPGSNSAVLEISGLPPLDLERRLNYLIRYPHGCLEQTVSAAFPQLYIRNLMDISNAYEKRITRNVRAALNKILRFQANDGGLSLWPGGSGNDWVTSYVGHFMLEAEKQGYALPVGLKSAWLTYQQNNANNWTTKDAEVYKTGLSQSYRLYTLALAGYPNLRAMNRLRETPGLCTTARWQLVSSYLLAGQPEAARQLANETGYDVSQYMDFNQTYGSDMRDKALILQSLSAIGDEENAFSFAQDISKSLTGKGWMSTQTTAFCLMSMSEYYNRNVKVTNGMRYEYAVDGNAQEISTDLNLTQASLNVDNRDKISLSFTNTDSKDLFLALAVSGKPLVDSINNVDNNISMSVVYRDIEGKVIDPSVLEQGTDFIAEISIGNAGVYTRYRDLALTQIFPSGWEIINKRMYNVPDALKESSFEYRDIRDDRVITYFSIYRRGTVKFVVLLNAAYAGRFYLPGPQLEAMYNNDVYARRSGKWVEVIKAE